MRVAKGAAATVHKQIACYAKAFNVHWKIGNLMVLQIQLLRFINKPKKKPFLSVI